MHTVQANFYNSQQCRELANRGHQPYLYKTRTNKRRLASIPFKLTQQAARRKEKTLRVASLSTYVANNEIILQHALKKRFNARPIRDLRIAGRRRRIFAGYRTPF